MTGLYGLELRAVTAALNASVLPIAVRTEEHVERGVEAAGIHAPVMVMRGDGGATDPAGLRREPARALYSGPAASVAGVLRHVATGGGDRARGRRHVHQRGRRARRPSRRCRTCRWPATPPRCGPSTSGDRRGRRLDGAGPQGPALRRRAPQRPHRRVPVQPATCPPSGSRAPSPSWWRRGPTTRPTTWCSAWPTARRRPSPTPARRSRRASCNPATTLPRGGRRRRPRRLRGGRPAARARRPHAGRAGPAHVGRGRRRPGHERGRGVRPRPPDDRGGGWRGRRARSATWRRCSGSSASCRTGRGDLRGRRRAVPRAGRAGALGPQGQVVDGAELAASAEAGASRQGPIRRRSTSGWSSTPTAPPCGRSPPDGGPGGRRPARSAADRRRRGRRDRGRARAPARPGRSDASGWPPGRGRRAGLPSSCSTASATRSPPGRVRCSGSTPPTHRSAGPVRAAVELVARCTRRKGPVVDRTHRLGRAGQPGAPGGAVPARRRLPRSSSRPRTRLPRSCSRADPPNRGADMAIYVPAEHAPPPPGPPRRPRPRGRAGRRVRHRPGHRRPGVEDAVSDVQEPGRRRGHRARTPPDRVRAGRGRLGRASRPARSPRRSTAPGPSSTGRGPTPAGSGRPPGRPVDTAVDALDQRRRGPRLRGGVPAAVDTAWRPSRSAFGISVGTD